MKLQHLSFILPIFLTFIHCAPNQELQKSPDQTQHTVKLSTQANLHTTDLTVPPEIETLQPIALDDSEAPMFQQEDCQVDSVTDSDSPQPLDETTDGDRKAISSEHIFNKETTAKASSAVSHDPPAMPSSKLGQHAMDEALDFCDVAQSYWQNGELDKALETLDNAYSLILSVDTVQEEKLIQQKEDLRFLISKRILEIYASRNIVVNGNFDEIPMESNDYISAEINRFATGPEMNFFRQSLERAGQYRPYIVEALKQAGLPEELSWLPLIESGFKTKALSRARALGLWQFIPSTGYKFGLKRTRYVDERMDFIKATDAAIAYLKELHNIFGDWATVLAAYNCGEGRVLQVIRSQNINYLDNFWDLYQRLPLETARYVPRFFATLHIVKNPEQYGMEDVVPKPGLSFETITIDRQLQLKDVASATDIDLDTLKLLNPELRYQIIPPDGFQLRVPTDASTDGFQEKLASIPTTKIPEPAYAWHRVKSGDTLSTIARKYGSSVSKIMRANNLRSSHIIRVGMRLKVPKRGYTVADSPSEPSKLSLPPSGTHWVRKGDSLWKIAKRYGVTVEQIKSINGLSSSDLHIGQKLQISKGVAATPPNSAKVKTYLVKQGDSPYTIAQQHNMALDRFLLINQLTDRSRIYPGQELSIE